MATKNRGGNVAKRRKTENDVTKDYLGPETPAEEMIVRPFKWTEKQQKVIDAALDPKTRIIFIKGPPGCGKTLLAVYCSLLLFKDKGRKKINYVRIPLEASNHKIGFLPSTMAEKMTPHLAPCMDHLRELVDESHVQGLIDNERVVAVPIGFIKGLTLGNCSVIFDECEDANLQEFELMLGRMGKNSILFCCGDARQSNVKESGFSKVYNSFSEDDSKAMGIHSFEFTTDECMRSPITKFILDKMEKLRFTF